VPNSRSLALAPAHAASCRAKSPLVHLAFPRSRAPHLQVPACLRQYPERAHLQFLVSLYEIPVPGISLMTPPKFIQISGQMNNRKRNLFLIDVYVQAINCVTCIADPCLLPVIKKLL